LVLCPYCLIEWLLDVIHIFVVFIVAFIRVDKVLVVLKRERFGFKIFLF
jgi:uncharacterized membrane protein